MPTRKPDTTSCALYVTEEHDSYGAFYHVNVSIVRTIEGDKVRNLCWSGWSDEHGLNGFADLLLRSQGCDKDVPRRLYGFEALYQNAYLVDGHRATVMAKTLTSLNKKLDQIDQLRGRAVDYAEFVGRVAEALKITRMVIKTTTNKGHMHDDQQHRVVTLGEGVDHVRRLVQAWVKASEPAAQEVA